MSKMEALATKGLPECHERQGSAPQINQLREANSQRRYRRGSTLCAASADEMTG